MKNVLLVLLWLCGVLVVGFRLTNVSSSEFNKKRRVERTKKIQRTLSLLPVPTSINPM